jgi:hypothetical protein
MIQTRISTAVPFMLLESISFVSVKHCAIFSQIFRVDFIRRASPLLSNQQVNARASLISGLCSPKAVVVQGGPGTRQPADE